MPTDRNQSDFDGSVEAQFFQFESDFVASLRCIPMIVRFKLDLCGVKLSLRAWSRFDQETRALCVSLPTRSAKEIADYGTTLCHAIEQIGQQPVLLEVDQSPAWVDVQCVPPVVVERAEKLGIGCDRFDRWSNLPPLHRFALVKLTRGGHENENFRPALKEFGLL